MQIAGCGAIVASPNVGDPSQTCTVLVDVNDGQSIETTFAADPDTPGVSHGVACQGARDLATMAVRNLAAGR